MKRYILLLLVLLVVLSACRDKEVFIPILTVDDACTYYIPFYERQDSQAISLNIECVCQDSFVDLNTRLLPYKEVELINFNCNTNQFDQIPAMPSVKQLTSDVVTSNIQAFQNLEVFKNKSYLETPIPYQIIFLPKLKEVVLLNATNFHEIIGTKDLEVFKMTFQNTATREITLPSNLSALTNLKELTIRNINLAMFTNFDNLVSLESLQLSNVLWVRIPQSPNQWSKLRELELSEVRLRGSIPDIFDDMDSLETIYISETELTATTQRHIYQAPNLKELTFSYCEMEAIPEEIGGLTSLQKLIINSDQSTSTISINLPSTISNLTHLKSIFLSTNATEFPAGLLGLTHTLEAITIQDNIGSLPPEIGDFVALKTLKLTNCNLTALPSEIQKLATTLDKLHLTGNNFSPSARQQIMDWLPNTQIYF